MDDIERVTGTTQTSAAHHGPIAGDTLHVDEPRVASAWRDRWERWRQDDPDDVALLVSA